MNVPKLTKSEKLEGIYGHWNINTVASIKAGLISALRYNKSGIYQRKRYKCTGDLMAKSLSEDYFDIASGFVTKAKKLRA